MEILLRMSFDTFLRLMATIIIAYLLGSINFGIIITRIVAKKDIRTMGSGNAGSTNVLRSVGKLPAILTFVFDFLKAVAAVLIGSFLFKTANIQNADPTIVYEYQILGKYIAGLFVILGHMFPVYFKFKGGKGVVTTIATIMLIQWRVGLILIGVFIIVVLITRYVSLGSMIAAFLYGFVTFVIEYDVDYLAFRGAADTAMITPRFIIVSTFCAFTIGYLVIIKHYENIYRLTRHEEKKLTFKRKNKS